jgi:hypothetical protein
MNILYVENHAIFAENVKNHFLSHHSVTVVPSLAAARSARNELHTPTMVTKYAKEFNADAASRLRTPRKLGKKLTY